MSDIIVPCSFAIAVNNEDVLKENALASPIFSGAHPHEIIIKRRHVSAGPAYNGAIDEAKNDIVIFMHQDVYLPADWDKRLKLIIGDLEACWGKIGVLGCFGISIDGLPVGHVYSNGLNCELGEPQLPMPVQSLDELLLVFRKSSGLKFDPELPGFHLHGTDICLQSKSKGFANFAISNFCIHNSLPCRRLPPEFWRCADYLCAKWKKELPIKTCCTLLHPSRVKMRILRAKSNYFMRQRNKRERLRNPGLIMPQNIE